MSSVFHRDLASATTGRASQLSLASRNVLALDIDGVLLDSRRGGLGPWDHELSANIDVRASDLSRHFFSPYWEDIVIGHLPLRPTLDVALRQMGSQTSAEILQEFWFRQDCHLIDDAVDAAGALAQSGATIVLLTNQEALRARHLYDVLAERIPIAAFVYSGAIGLSKEDPEFFRYVARRYDIDCERLLFVDDTPANVAAARAAEWPAVLHHQDRADQSWNATAELLTQRSA